MMICITHTCKNLKRVWKEYTAMQLRYTVQIKDTKLLFTQRRQLPPDKLQVAFIGQQSPADWKSLLT